MMAAEVLQLEPLVVSAGEAAKLLNVSRPTLYTLLNRDDFPSFRVGNRVLVSVSGLKEWVDRQTAAKEARDDPE